MTTAPYILGDWGTTSARFHLCRDGAVVATVTGPGAKFTDDLGQAYREAVAPWVDQHGPLMAVLCGMVGSNIGWCEAGYMACPAMVSDFVDQMISVSDDSGYVHIVPGVKTASNFMGLPDVMRGEETQILGWAAHNGGDGFLCLPGTHTKWVDFKDGKITNFTTSLNGELYNVLAQHSILLGADPRHEAQLSHAFRYGVEVGAATASLNQVLFSARALQLNGTYDPAQATSYLLGLLIGSDVKSGLELAGPQTINIIGGAKPTSFYQDAIIHLGVDAKVFDGQDAVLQGLVQLYKYLNR